MARIALYTGPEAVGMVSTGGGAVQITLRRVSTASLIRQAASEFQIREQRGSAASFQGVLKQTAGTWQTGDGLEYQERMRQEWP